MSRTPWTASFGVQVTLGGVSLSIADVPDLALLKLYADGPQDRADVLVLVQLHPGALEVITQRLDTAPEEVSEAWARVLGTHGRTIVPDRVSRR